MGSQINSDNSWICIPIYRPTDGNFKNPIPIFSPTDENVKNPITGTEIGTYANASPSTNTNIEIPNL